MKTYLERWEIELLEEAADNMRDRLLIRLLSRLGCRVSEALALTVEDIDLQQGTITVQHLKARLNLACPSCHVRLGKGHVFCPGCGARADKTVAESRVHRRVRMLPVDSGTIEMLHDYIQRGGPVKRKDNMFIFGLTRHRAWQVLRECSRKAGLADLVNPETGKIHGVSPHRLRDAFAVHAIKHDDSGDGLRMLQEHLGHQSFNTTAKYRKVAGEELREWYQKLWERDNR